MEALECFHQFCVNGQCNNASNHYSDRDLSQQMKILRLHPIAFTIGDAETPPSGLTLSGTSSNATLVPNANITFGGGTGANRNVVITPVAGESGTTTITITVSDGTLCFHQFCVNGEC